MSVESPEYSIPGVTPDDSPLVPVPADPASPSSPAGATAGDGPSEPQYSPNVQQRIRELVDQRRRVEAQYAEAQSEQARVRAEADLYKRQVEALTGLKQSPQEDPQKAAIRAALYEVMPQLKQLEGLPVEKLMELVNTVPQLQAQAQSQYDSLADQTVTNLYTAAKAEMYGGRDLTPFQQANLHAAFVRFVESEPKHANRYIYRDASLVSDFLKTYTAEMLDPVRRQAAVSVGQRVARAANIPTGGGAGGPVGTAPPAAPKDEDALHDAAWAALRSKLGG